MDSNLDIFLNDECDSINDRLLHVPYSYHSYMDNDQTNLNISFTSDNGLFTIFVIGGRSVNLIHCISDELGVGSLAQTGIYHFPIINDYNPILGLSAVNNSNNIRVKIRYTAYLAVVDVLLIVEHCSNLIVSGSAS